MVGNYIGQTVFEQNMTWIQNRINYKKYNLVAIY